MMMTIYSLVVYLATEAKKEVPKDQDLVDPVSEVLEVLDLVQAYLNLNHYFKMMISSTEWEEGAIFLHLGLLLLERKA